MTRSSWLSPLCTRQVNGFFLLFYWYDGSYALSILLSQCIWRQVFVRVLVIASELLPFATCRHFANYILPGSLTQIIYWHKIIPGYLFSSIKGNWSLWRSRVSTQNSPFSPSPDWNSDFPTILLLPITWRKFILKSILIVASHIVLSGSWVSKRVAQWHIF